MITNFKIYEGEENKLNPNFEQEFKYGMIGLNAVYDIAFKKVKIIKYYKLDVWSIPEIDVQFLDGTIKRIKVNKIDRKLTPEEIEQWEIDFEVNKYNL